MTYPAWFDLIDDPEIVGRPLALLALRVYARLVVRPGIFTNPQLVKVEGLAFELRAKRERVARALDLLAHCGYITEHGRETRRRIRSMTVEQNRRDTRPPKGSHLRAI